MNKRANETGIPIRFFHLRWLVGFVGVALASQASAAGFQLFEQSGSGLGNAYAGGAAAAEDASTVFFNPAGMSNLPGNNVVGAFHAIAPSADYSDTGSTTVLGTAVSGATQNDAGVTAIVPNLYFTTDTLGHGLTIGAGIDTPFGLKTQYDGNWVGRYQALKSHLQTIDLKGSFAYKVNERLSVGGGLDFVRASAELTNALDFGAICFANVAAATCSAGTLVPGNSRFDGRARVEGDDWGVGYNLGVLFEPWKDTRIGAVFHSKVDLKLEGYADFTTPTFAGPLAGFAPLTARFTDTNAIAKLTLPEVASFSVFSQLNPQWAIMADVTWTNWSRFEKLTVDFANTLPNNEVVENWEDTFRFAGGVTYTFNANWKFRGGVAYDESPIKDQFRTPRIPDEDRLWMTFGIARNISDKGTIDLGYAHLFVNDASLNKRGESDGGTLRGSYENAVDIVSLQYTHRF